MPKISIKYKSEVLREYIIKKRNISVGRVKGNDIILNDKAISEKHCVFKFEKGNIEVEDLNSAFGTNVNGISVKQQEVGIGEEIGIGNFVLVIKPQQSEEGKKEAEYKDGRKPAYLLGVQGKMLGKKYELNPVDTKIGRSEEFNDVWIAKEHDKSVSRRHATISFSEGKYVLTDRRSKNRTFVNQKQVGKEDEITIKEKDEILIGKSIFRFLTSEKDDYSTPSRAGVFWVRFSPKFKKIVACLLFAGAMFLSGKGISSLIIINEKPSDFKISDMQWRAERLGYSTGEYLQEKLDIIPSTAIGDITGDGNIEVVMADLSGNIYAWEGSESGKLLWKKKIGNSQLTSPVIMDINNDQIPDIIVGSDDSKVYVLDGISGEIIFISEFLGGKLSFASSPLVKDLDGDGFRDIVVTTDDRVVCFLYSPASSTHRPYYFKTPEDIMSSPVVLSGRETDIIAIATNGGKLYMFNAVNPENRDVVDITRKINMEKGVNLVLNELAAVPAVADLNEDGIDDLVMTTSAYYVVALNGRDYSLLWSYKIRPYSTLESPIRYASPVITESYENGPLAIAVGWANGRIIALSARSGEVLWKYSIGEESRIIGSPVVADFNKDQLMDFLFINEDGKILLVKGGKHTEGDVLLDSFSIREKITATPCVGDINGDGYLEILVNSIEGNIHMLATPTRVFDNKILWAGFRRDSENSGRLYFNDIVNKPFYFSLIGIGILIIFLEVVIGFISKKRRQGKKPKVTIIK